MFEYLYAFLCNRYRAEDGKQLRGKRERERGQESIYRYLKRVGKYIHTYLLVRLEVTGSEEVRFGCLMFEKVGGFGILGIYRY